MLRRLAVAVAVVLCSFPSVARGQAFASDASGFGVEVGFGPNELRWTTTVDSAAVSDDRDELLLTPSVRVHYNKKFYSSLHIMPFVGYNEFGGRSGVKSSPTDPAVTYREEIRFRALEFGAFLGYRWPSVQVNAGTKLSQALDIEQTVEYETGSGPVSTVEAERFFRSSTMSWGARFEVQPWGGLTVSAEAWFGMGDLQGDEFTNDDVRQRHYRLMVGWRFR